jgi:isocitrate lyase
MTEEQLSNAITIQHLFKMQVEVDNLESTLKIKREQFLDACRRWYPGGVTTALDEPVSTIYSDKSGYELHWIPRSVRSIVGAKLKQDMPATYNMLVKESVTVSDAEKALGDDVEKYITTRTTYSPKIILLPESDAE